MLNIGPHGSESVESVPLIATRLNLNFTQVYFMSSTIIFLLLPLDNNIFSSLSPFQCTICKKYGVDMQIKDTTGGHLK